MKKIGILLLVVAVIMGNAAFAGDLEDVSYENVERANNQVELFMISNEENF